MSQLDRNSRENWFVFGKVSDTCSAFISSKIIHKEFFTNIIVILVILCYNIIKAKMLSLKWLSNHIMELN